MEGVNYFVHNNVYCVFNTNVYDSKSLEILTTKVQDHLLQSGIEDKVFLFQSSGSTGKPKFIIHTYNTLRECALGCQEWLKLTSDDRWMNVLSEHHMGGFSTYFRTEVLGLKTVVSDSWDLNRFVKKFEENQCTLVSLVPSQVYQIVEASLRAPQGIKVALVGGGALSPDLKLQAQELGWPIISSLGSTETGSQIFTESLGGFQSGAYALPHFFVKTNEQDVLMIKGNGLFKGYITVPNTFDEIQVAFAELDTEGYWTSSDRVKLEGRKLVKFYGRTTEQIKILGHLVDMSSIREDFAKHLKQYNMTSEVHIDYLKDIKAENLLVVFTVGFNREYDRCIKDWNKSAKPQHAIRATYFIKQIPKSDLGKTQTYLLKDLFGS